MSLNSTSNVRPLSTDRIRLKLAERAVMRALAGLRHGRISLTLPSGQVLEKAGREPGPDATLKLHSWRPLWYLFSRGDVGIAESYVEGEWDSPDIVALIEFVALNSDPNGRRPTGLLPARLIRRLWHLCRRNNRRGSRKNVAFHYDLGNAFYRQWLDRRMIYSSALFDSDETSLDRAQDRKIELIVDQLRLSGSESVLEIGCGWGALAARIAKDSGSVTGITLSREQLAHAREMLECQGLAEKTEIRLEDYRDVQGQFDRIVSIEMVEAVGEAYWPTYFSTLSRCLKPGGRIVLQSITIDADRFERYRRGADFIQTYIFPGGMLPTEAIIADQARHAGLSLVESQRFGRSYALTLSRWREQFIRTWPEIRQLGFPDEFRRQWEYYLSYCEGGFRAGTIDVGLYVFER